MKYETIIFEKEDGVATVTLNRPEKQNALSTLLIDELHGALDEFEADDSLKVLLITGKEGSFCAGADLGDVEKLLASSNAVKFLRNAQRAFSRIEFMPKPVIACVNGLALGGGCEMSLACDLRIASNNAVFGLPEVKLGVLPSAGGTQRLPRLVGMTKAMELLLTGDTISADEALRIGLVNKVVPADSLMKEAMKLAKSIARKPALAVKAIKVSAKSSFNTDLESGLALELSYASFLLKTEDMREGIKAFFEGRKPVFKGM